MTNNLFVKKILLVSFLIGISFWIYIIMDTFSKAIKIHNEVITIDTHCDIDLKNFTDENNYSMDTDSQVNIPKIKDGGLDVSWLVVYTVQDSLNDNGYEKAYINAINKFNAIHRLIKDYSIGQLSLATSSSDVFDIVNSGKKAIMIGVENGYPIGENINIIDEFYKRGARYMSLSHNDHNQLSDSNTGEYDGFYVHNGLSDLGKKAVIRMNELGMIIDISHPSKESIIETLKLSKAPLIASHSSARHLCNHARNLDNELLDLIKQNGGVVQTVAFAKYLKEESIFDPNKVSVKHLVDHIDYMVSYIGIDHVGISSDFDGGGGVLNWKDASETFNVTYELVKRGYSKEQIKKLWGLNLLRVLDEVEKISKELRANNLAVQ
ncbi:MAG: peptidase M19 [Flavobacteriaceae bacterium]|nr:peptidase M19 [Flavobacteriaceae bacterium]|tara:strand:+ start:120 stop:1256 length:1137 start_codon:yes stop_codon:yes gene_type:complete